MNVRSIADFYHFVEMFCFGLPAIDEDPMSGQVYLGGPTSARHAAALRPSAGHPDSRSPAAALAETQ